MRDDDSFVCVESVFSRWGIRQEGGDDVDDEEAEGHFGGKWWW